MFNMAIFPCRGAVMISARKAGVLAICVLILTMVAAPVNAWGGLFDGFGPGNGIGFGFGNNLGCGLGYGLGCGLGTSMGGCGCGYPTCGYGCGCEGGYGPGMGYSLGYGLGYGLGAGLAAALSTAMPGLAGLLNQGTNSQSKSAANAPSK